MMKKILVFSTCLLMLGLMIEPVSAQISYCKDILEEGNPPAEGTCDVVGGACTTDLDCFDGAFTCLKPTLKTWDETWVMNQGETMEMDIWLNDVPENMLTSGVYITYDPALIEILNLIPNDTNNGGPWDGGGTGNFTPSPGVWILNLVQFSCVAPDGDGDIFLGRVTFQCQAAGDVDVTFSTIPDFDTIVGCGGTTYDVDIPTNTVTVTQNPGAGCTVPDDCPDDGNLCTVADCVDGTCVFDPLDCDDADACTVDSCDPATGCASTPLDCDDDDACTTDSCDPATGCINEPVECDDGDLCTDDFCDPVTGCGGVSRDCDDNNVCTEDSCDPATGFCVNDIVKECSDGDPCTLDICDPVTGACSNPPNTCNDNIECTIDSCDPETGCLNEPDDILCNDDADCTDDICDPDAGCQNEDNCDPGFLCDLEGEPPACQPEPTCSVTITPPAPRVDVLETVQFDVVVDGTGSCVDPSYTWAISDTGCTGDATGSSIGSTVDQDGLYTAGDEPGTESVIVRVSDVYSDTCAAAEVIVRKRAIPPSPPPLPSGCKTDDDCDDGVFCNGAETCTGGSCVDGTLPCRAELCDEDTDTCIDCLVDDDCDDGVDCTDDSCVDETCENTPNDDRCPDDGLFCNGEEFCDEAEGCSSTGDPCGAGETCDEDTDSCVGVGVCSIDVFPETLPKSHWIPLGPGLIRINTVDVNPTLFTPVTITCDTDGMGFAPQAVTVSLIKFVIGDVIFQPVIVWPAIATESLEMENETCTVTIGDCKDADTFDLQYLSIGGFPLRD